LVCIRVLVVRSRVRYADTVFRISCSSVEVSEG
jgi:hypothetical protein